jgi:hypothetical protein
MRPQRPTIVAACGLAGLSLGLAGTCAAHHYGGGFKSALAVWGERTPAGADRSPMHEIAPAVQVADSGGNWPFSFLESLFGLSPQSAPRRSYQPEDRRLPQSAPRSAPRQKPVPAAEKENAGATYRTMCVRLCDGYYWPVSFATAMDHFARDAQTCTRSCGTPVALYYYRNPGGEAEEMVSLGGQPYKNLGTAFLYRTVYDPGCKCRAHPWEDAAIERHKGYAKAGRTRAAAQGLRRNR